MLGAEDRFAMFRRGPLGLLGIFGILGHVGDVGHVGHVGLVGHVAVHILNLQKTILIMWQDQQCPCWQQFGTWKKTYHTHNC
jgi:hypothetical protein